MEDTLQTVKNYEGARLEYDAYAFEVLNSSPDSEQKQQLDKDLQIYKEKYDRLKNDVLIKSRFLDENRIKVMKKQLILFQTATAAFYSNNSLALNEIIKQFNDENVIIPSLNLTTDNAAMIGIAALYQIINK